MSSSDPDQTIRAALAKLQLLGMDTTSLKLRLDEPIVAQVIVGPWPPDGNDEREREGLIKARALFLEALELVMAKGGDQKLVGPLSSQVAEISRSMTSSSVGIGSGAFSDDVLESIVGRWPPD